MVEWFVGGSIVVFYLIQTVIADKIAIFGVAPDLILTVIICYSVLAGREKGIIAALFTGIIVDLLSVGMFGVNLLTYTYVALIAAIFGNNFFGKNSLTTAFITFVLSIMTGIIGAVIMYVTKTDKNILFLIFAVGLPRSLYNCIISVFYYALIDNIAVKSYR